MNALLMDMGDVWLLTDRSCSNSHSSFYNTAAKSVGSHSIICGFTHLSVKSEHQIQNCTQRDIMGICDFPWRMLDLYTNKRSINEFFHPYSRFPLTAYAS